ncbi:hypothetical protein C8Q75DRAFT_730290 [Abortiporus biennis]|nr:hypothetical protein C8Q75DRAFT_730290 [Abortiporus biennis]
MSSSRTERRAIATDTLSRIDEIVRNVPGASQDSTFISAQLPLLDRGQCPNHPPVTIIVVNSDSFTAARNIIKQDPNAKLKTAVLNLASDEWRAGGWVLTLSKTQEEALCYSSTLYPTLKEEYYPWPNVGPESIKGIYSPGIVIFKDDLDHDCVDLPFTDRQVVSVISVAAPRDPPLTNDQLHFKHEQDLDCMREKIRLVYRIAAHNGQEYVVLGAMGCGAYGCPPQGVAEEMKSILQEPEFKGFFKKIVFAVYSTSDNPNYDIFRRVLDRVAV